ncbi:MAG: uridine diphosphate-N-acetylglucosamine-binding protein YvcK [Solobacterium sp.]|nr:uridine diphosphate-N-acetylglucosamine-binding protein YvcK [Solobacterium sp.]
MSKKIVVIGGGHGQSAICRGIKNIDDVDITAIVTVADDGGSTGRLRKKFHIPAMGDIRNVMISLAESESLMSNLMDYRFDDEDGSEEDVAGHNLGNLVLTALTQQTGSFMQAIQEVEKILKVKGTIVPATTQVITLFARMEDGVIVKGEANIPESGNRIQEVFYEVPVKATPEAIKAITEADLILYGIGSVYTSILPNTIIPEIKHALTVAKAKKYYLCNAMTQPGETDNYSVEDHVNALIRHGCDLDSVIVASDRIPTECVVKYNRQGSIPVVLKQENHSYGIISASLLDFSHNLVRHDSNKIGELVKSLLKE